MLLARRRRRLVVHGAWHLAALGARRCHARARLLARPLAFLCFAAPVFQRQLELKPTSFGPNSRRSERATTTSSGGLASGQAAADTQTRRSGSHSAPVGLLRRDRNSAAALKPSRQPAGSTRLDSTSCAGARRVHRRFHFSRRCSQSERSSSSPLAGWLASAGRKQTADHPAILARRAWPSDQEAAPTRSGATSLTVCDSSKVALRARLRNWRALARKAPARFASFGGRRPKRERAWPPLACCARRKNRSKQQQQSLAIVLRRAAAAALLQTARAVAVRGARRQPLPPDEWRNWRRRRPEAVRLLSLFPLAPQPRPPRRPAGRRSLSLRLSQLA